MSDERTATGTGPAGGEQAHGAVSTRRALLVGAGAAGATVVLAGCGADPEDGAASTPGAGTNGGGTRSTGGTQSDGAGQSGGALARTADVPVGGGLILAGQGVVITQPTEGTFKAFSAICTHQRCPVSKVDDGTITCTCHGSKFSIEDGSVKNGPATKPLAAREIKVEGENIVA